MYTRLLAAPLGLCLLLLAGCDKTLEDSLNPKSGGYTVYTIQQGQQYSLTPPSEFKGTEMNFKVIFDSSAIYTTVVPENQHDINKLYGFSDCGKEHHTESARFGWRWSEDSLRLYAYCYTNSVMNFKQLGIARIGAEHSCRIAIDGNKYLFTLDGKVDTMARGCNTTEGSRYRLYPFFGGSENAPHAIVIKIKEE